MKADEEVLVGEILKTADGFYTSPAFRKALKKNPDKIITGTLLVLSPERHLLPDSTAELYFELILPGIGICHFYFRKTAKDIDISVFNKGLEADDCLHAAYCEEHDFTLKTWPKLVYTINGVPLKLREDIIAALKAKAPRVSVFKHAIVHIPMLSMPSTEREYVFFPEPIVPAE